MISKTFDFDYLIVNDEVEAMITEANMIKDIDLSIIFF